ncbi:hypothetical protein GOQ27_10340 [Clostridium sp. D2Q-11]|uniref:Uncharacterized protein n=1 Tax=Anaeromonas frigoriresistens TaxID=2683708 RepID=A0A942Z9G9_9FIRM|nr:hypothetical protein [Anaeromonas frigoriresistens]MBS4538865.1 hypothetical protein [Anaeromonas frigoriresistens]
MKKYGKFIGFLALVLIELIFYLTMKDTNLDFFFLVWTFIWLVMLVYGFVNIFQEGKSLSNGNPLGHPRDFLMAANVKTNTSSKAINTFGTVALVLFLFILNLTGYFIFM